MHIISLHWQIPDFDGLVDNSSSCCKVTDWSGLGTACLIESQPIHSLVVLG